MTKKHDVDELKRHVQQLAPEMRAWESDDLPESTRQAFWSQVLELEQAPMTTNLEQLLAAGVDVPPPASLDDSQLTAKLWEVIHGLANLGVELHNTDHLSDRDLYTELYERVLRDEVPALSHEHNWTDHVDLVGTGSLENTRAYLTYYADEEERARWQSHFPDYQMPPRLTPPYDRDRHLP